MVLLHVFLNGRSSNSTVLIEGLLSTATSRGTFSNWLTEQEWVTIRGNSRDSRAIFLGKSAKIELRVVDANLNPTRKRRCQS
jgi:hypothetical protein